MVRLPGPPGEPGLPGNPGISADGTASVGAVVLRKFIVNSAESGSASDVYGAGFKSGESVSSLLEM